MVRIRMETASALVEIDPDRGGRLAALVIEGRPLLFSAPSLALQWGSYPMVPWAGRVADGRFEFAGRRHQLPRNLPPHSAHGLGFVSPWTVVDRRDDGADLAFDLDHPWPFAGRVEQRFLMGATSLTIEMTVTATEDMPLIVGWHPWFNRFVGRADGRPVEAQIDLPARSMYELDDRSIPTGRLVAPPLGPWDNCFTDLDGSPTITWPDLVELRLSSSCDHWVVYDRPGHAVCVEPQSDAPDAFNREPTILGAGDRSDSWFRLDWN